jgi:ligand-binding sensor domain-containing protein
VWQVFDMTTAGLPSNTVRAIAHDGIGGTWVGTDWGLCFYDGTDWDVFQMEQGLPENDVRALAVDLSGRVWVGLFTQGLAVKDGDTWSQYLPGTSPMPSEQVRNITHDVQGNAWVATTNGLAMTDLDVWNVYNNTDTSFNNQILPGVNIADVAVRGDGLVCIGTLNSGFTYMSGSSVLVYNTAEDFLPDNTALGVAIDSEGDRWAACPSGGLLRFAGPYDNGLFFQFITDFTNIPTNALNDVVIDEDDRKIIATQSAGVTILAANNTTWTTLNEANSGLPDDVVNCVSLAPDGSIWAGTESGGVARWDPTAGFHEERPPSLTVFPNPFSDQVFIQAGIVDGPITWTLSSATDRRVARTC